MSALKVDTEIQLALNDASLTLRVYRMALDLLSPDSVFAV